MTQPHMGTPGNFTGLKDRKGNDVHLGDTLKFDPKEWGGKCEYILTFEDGELRTHGTVGDITQWCTVIKKWNHKPPANLLPNTCIGSGGRKRCMDCRCGKPDPEGQVITYEKMADWDK